MKNIKSALLQCQVKQAELCLIAHREEVEERFIQEALLPLMDEMITSINRHPEAFNSEEASKMLTSIFESLRDDIHLEFDGSDRTVLVARRLVDIAVTDAQYGASLRRALMYLYEYGYKAISDRCKEVCDDTADQVR